MSELALEAQAWLLEDPDPDTREELRALLLAAESPGPEGAAALLELGDRFAHPLAFGTAGLRGALAAGPNRMNRAVVIRAAAGLAAHLGTRGGAAVVVGYDARRKSDAFARDTAQVLAGAGLRALLLPRPLPTPVLAYAVRHLGADAGVMVTASHNPAGDNGYKVYLGDGAQLAPPVDAEIAARIAAVGPLAAVPRSEGFEVLGDAVLESYLDRVAALVAPGSPRDVRVAYTALHGVGRDTLLAAFARAGFPAPLVVAEQGEPDPAFPTVDFPNPEEPGALDLALALAAREDADLVIANDPDADRCAVAVSGRVLTGDEVGALLARHLLARPGGLRGVLASSLVSSSLLARMAAAHGLPHVETLTGFKWIARVEGLGYGYEEALGYCVDPGGVRDKDGVAAALLLAELAAAGRASGTTLAGMLDDLAREHGLHATSQLSVRVGDQRETAAAMARLRERPPTSLGGRRVVSAEDLASGGTGLPPTEGLRYRLEGGGRVVVRPSGTEPKLKAYLEVVAPVTGDAGPVRAAAADALAAIRADLAAALAPG